MGDFNLKELIELRNVYDEGQWFAKIKLAEHCYTEIGIKGNEDGTFEHYFIRAEKVLKEFSTYEKIGLDFLRRFIPDDEDNKYVAFSITVDDFIHGEETEKYYMDLFGICASDFLKGKHSEKKSYSEGFVLTFSREINEADSFLFHVRFLPTDSSDLEFLPIGIDVQRY